MALIELTAEQRRLVEQAGDRPVRIEDPVMQQAYVLIRADVYERVRDSIEQPSVVNLEVPEGIRKSQEAFFRELPELLKNRRLRGKYVAYHGDERVKVSRSEVDVIRECVRRGLRSDQYDVFVIRTQSPGPEDLDYPSAWLDDCRSSASEPSCRTS
jgi:hypothetical protein